MPSSVWRKLMGGTVQLPRTRRLKRTFQNVVLTVVCGLTTILVLKGSTGIDSPSSINDASGNAAPYFLNHPLIRSGKPRAHFFTNYRNRPLHNHNLITNRNSRSHKSQNPHSQIPSLPTDHDQASQLPLIRSEVQHTRLLAAVHTSQASLPHALSTEKGENLNPDPNRSVISTNANPNLDHSNPNQDNTGTSNQSPNQTNGAYIDHENLNQINKASEKQRPQSQILAIHDKPSILLVTGSQPIACDNPMGDYYLMKSLKNKMDYCRLHNLDIFYNMANLDPYMSGFWAKLPLIYTLMLAHPEKEWLWWVDMDTMITDMAFELPMDRYKDYNLVLHGWKGLVYDEKSWIGLNTGSFLIRNCEWSLNLIEEWAPMGKKGKEREEAGHLLSKVLKGRPEFEADDQSALIYLLNEQKSKWASKVYLENGYYLHGYWLIIVHRYEEMMEKYHSGLGDERWPFVTHFVGCKPCSNYKKKVALQDECLEHMERAFNFADNQVLQFYGFQHEALNTHNVHRSTDLS